MTVTVIEPWLPLDQIRIVLVDHLDAADECRRWLSTRNRVAVDTECTGLSRQRDEVRLIQIGDINTAFVIPLESTKHLQLNSSALGVGVGYLRQAPTVQSRSLGWGGFAAELLQRFTGLVDMHNAPYDHSMIHRTLGVNIPRFTINDTRIMAHVLDSMGSIALKSLSKRYVDPLSDLGQHLLHDSMGRDTGWNWSNIPSDYAPYWFYAGLDTILTARLRDVLEPQVLASAPRSYGLELAVQWICEDMSNRGTLVDREYTDEFASRMVTYIQQTEQWCKEEYDLWPGSDSKVADALMRDGVTLDKRTKSGARFSVDKEVLGAIDHPLAEAVLGRRQAIKIVGYLNSYLELSAFDGFLHPSINSVGGTNKNPFEPGGDKGVRTGRMSMSDPNLQNVPIRTKEGSQIRQAFVSRPDHSWVKCDADQIESRIMAHLSGDQKMVDAFIAEGDFFVNMASTLFNEPDFKKSDPRRQFVKNGVYAKEYGAGITKFARTAGVKPAEAEAFMNAFDSMFPEVPRWIRNVEGVVRQRFELEGIAYARSPLTGRRHVVDSHQIYPIINYLIQGMAGELLKLKMIHADQAGLGQFMLFPVHDEIDFDVPNEDLPAFMTTLSDVMNDDSILRVPLTWSADVGPNWGACKA